MADLTNTEKRRLEDLLGMHTGYVLDFTNRTFHEFILDETEIDIYDERFAAGGTSKASRLRAFWNLEGNYLVAKVITALLGHFRTSRILEQQPIDPKEQALLEICDAIPNRLLQSSGGEHLDAIRPNSSDKDFNLLAAQIRDSISRNEPQAALDRLHTFVMRFLRELCGTRGIVVDKAKPLQSYLGEYIKRIKASGQLESEMSERILKSSISVLDAFNSVRNDQSLAHDNPILNQRESKLILDHVAATIRFIQALETSSEGND